MTTRWYPVDYYAKVPEHGTMDPYSVGSRTDRREERLSRTSALAASRGDRVSIHSLRDRINALRQAAIDALHIAEFTAAVNGAAHDCTAYRLPDGDCEACWLATK